MAKDNKETIIRNPIPDSERPELQDDPSRYDFDFQVAPTTLKKKEEQNNTQTMPDKEEEPEPAPTPDKEEPSEPEPGEKEDGKDKPVPEKKEPDKSEPTPDFQAEITTLKGENESLKSEIESLKGIRAAIDEIQKAPEVFIRKHFPSLAPQVSPYKMIADRLKQDPKFGQDFRFDPNEAYIEGTQSYEYRLREEEMKDQFRREEMKIESQRLEQNAAMERRIAEDKSRIMKDFNLTEQQFEKEVVEWAKKQPNSLYNVARLRFMDDMIKKAVSKAVAESKGRKVDIDGKPAAGAKDIHGTSESKPEHLKELSEDWGDV